VQELQELQELQNGTTDFQCINARTSLIPFYELRWPLSRTPELPQLLSSVICEICVICGLSLI
jgi:hypothetical protein